MKGEQVRMGRAGEHHRTGRSRDTSATPTVNRALERTKRGVLTLWNAAMRNDIPSQMPGKAAMRSQRER